MSVGVLGGSFNPVHKDHLELALYVRGRLQLDRMVILPNASPPHKNTCALGFSDRFEMLKLALKDYSDFELCDAEKDESVPHYSFNTAGELKKLYKGEKIFFVMGMDSLNYLDKWYRGLELTDVCSLAVVQREGYRLEDSNAAVLEYLKEYAVYDDAPDFEEKLKSCSNYCFILSKKFNLLSSSALRNEFKSFYQNFSSASDLKAHTDSFPLINRYLSDDIVSYILKKRLYN